jgi:hypothetical protein
VQILEALADALARGSSYHDPRLDRPECQYRRGMPHGGPVNHLRRAACRCGPPPEDCVADATVLTQFGRKTELFRNAPRIERELGVSLLMGEQTAEEALRYVLQGNSPTRQQLSQAVTRLTSVGKLRKAGFAVVHTPGRVAHGIHVSVVWPGADPLNRQDVPWPGAVSELFDSCFNEKRGGGRK